MSEELNKPRCDAWECTLSEEQQWSLYEKARGRNWVEISTFLLEEYGTEPAERNNAAATDSDETNQASETAKGEESEDIESAEEPGAEAEDGKADE